MNRSITRAVCSLAIMLFLSTKITAQETQPLSLPEAINAATENNTAVRIATLDEQIANMRYKQTNAGFLPQAAFSYTAFSSNNPLNAFGFKLQQRGVTAEDFNPSLLNHPNSTIDFVTRLDVQQPLINPDLVYKRKAAATEVEAAGLASQRTKEQLAFEVQKAYLQLQLAYKTRSVLQSALQTAQSFQKRTNDYFLQGLLQKSDLLNASLQVTTIQTKIAGVENNIRNASDFLSWLMNKPAGTVYSVTNQEAILSDTATSTITNNRADLKAFAKHIASQEQLITSSKRSLLPRLNAFASYQFNNQGMFKYDANAYLAGIQLSWDIFKGYATKNKIAEQQLEKQKMQQQLQQQTDHASLMLLQAKRELDNARYSMQQNREAVAQAEESLRILQNRFQQGLVTSADVLAAQTQVSQQQLAYAEAVYQYNFSIYHIQFLTSTVK